MNERTKPDSLKHLDDRLRRLREQEEGKKPKAKPDADSGLGLAMRIGVDLVAALLVGGGIGYLLDRWLETQPWLMVAFLLLGAAAGMVNVYRVMSGMNLAVGNSAEKARKDPSVGRPREDESNRDC